MSDSIEVKSMSQETETKKFENLLPANQIQPKAFHYKVSVGGSIEPVFVTVIALNSTSAKNGLSQHPAFCGKTISYYGMSDHIIQVN